MTELQFDEGSHVYRLDGRRIVNVTRVLDHFCHTYDHVDRAVLERARQEGLAIHRTIEWYIKGTLDACPAWLLPYIEAWDAFQYDTGFELEGSELRLYHEGEDYCGTADLVGWMNLPKLGRRHVLPDIKRSFCAGPAIGLQTAAYAAAYFKFDGSNPAIDFRFALRFRPGKKPPYQVQHYRDQGDYEIFRSMLRTYKWLEREGKL